MTAIHFTDPNLLVDGQDANDVDALTPLRELDAVAQAMAHNMHAGRLSISGSDPTAQSATPVTTLYLLPYHGNVSSQRDANGNWIPLQIPDAGVSLDVTALAPNTNYDIWEYNNSGNIALAYTPWSSGTVRITGLSPADGVYLRTGTPTQKYRGTIRTVNDGGTTKAIDSNASAAQLLVWNMFNRVQRRAYFSEPTGTWSYTTTAWRYANNNSNAKIEFVNGLLEDSIVAQLMTAAATITGTCWTGIGFDSSSAAVVQARAAADATMNCRHSRQAPIGHHTITALEYGATASTFVGAIEHVLDVLWRA